VCQREGREGERGKRQLVELCVKVYLTAWALEKRADGSSGLGGGHRGGIASIGVIGLVEGEHVLRGVRPVDHLHSLGDIGGEGHHGNLGHCHVGGGSVGAWIERH